MIPLLYVMGPSGAGKDAILRHARAAVTPGEKIAFSHRYVTRQPDSRHEDFVSLTAAEFETRRNAGLFTFDWEAYRLRYGVGAEIELWRQAGFVVVVSGSRAHFRSLGKQPGHMIPVLVTVPIAVLAQRLASRARESVVEQALRLERAEQFAVSDPALVTIDNSGPIEAASATLLHLARTAR